MHVVDHRFEERQMPSLLECRACGGPVSSEAASCPKCGQPRPQPKAEDLPSPTYLKDRFWWWVLAFFLISAYGIGVIMMLVMGFSPYRTGTCPYCRREGRWHRGRVVRHGSCGKHSIRLSDTIFPAEDQRSKWDGRTVA